jgi:hypothetical protein
MKTLNNINLTDAFRFAANISGRLTSDLTLGDVADTFNNISTMVNELIMSSAPQSATSAFTASPATPAKLRGRPLGVKNAAPTPAKAPKAPKTAKAPKAEKSVSKNKTGGERAPRGQRQHLVKDVVAEAGGTMAFAAVAKGVIDREGATGDAAKILLNSVYALLNKMIEKGEATLASDDPKTIRIKPSGKKPAAESGEVIIEIAA